MIPDTTRRCTILDNDGRSSFILDWGRCVLNIGCYMNNTLPLLSISSPPSQNGGDTRQFKVQFRRWKSVDFDSVFVFTWGVIDEKPCLRQWVGANRTTSHYLYQIEPVQARTYAALEGWDELMHESTLTFNLKQLRYKVPIHSLSLQ